MAVADRIRQARRPSTAELSPDASFALSDDGNSLVAAGLRRDDQHDDVFGGFVDDQSTRSSLISVTNDGIGPPSQEEHRYGDTYLRTGERLQIRLPVTQKQDTPSESAGRTVYAAAESNPFFEPYFEQEIALSGEEFAMDIAPRFTPSFLSYAVSTNRTPASCIPPSEFESFFHEDPKQPGSYSSAIYVRYNDLVDFRDGDIEFPPGFNEKYKSELRTVAVETTKVADEHHTNPSVTNPLVAIIYNGLTSYNVVYNPDAMYNEDARMGRMQEHLAGGSGKSLHSAGIALFIDSDLFPGSQHLYGLTAPAEYGDVATTAGLEVFESAALVSGGRGWSSTYGETFNKACVGLVSEREDREEQLWQMVWRLRVLFDDNDLLTDDHVPSYLADIARGSVLKDYIFQTHSHLRKGVDDSASITLRQFSSAISAHAAAVRWGIPMDDARAQCSLCTYSQQAYR